MPDPAVDGLALLRHAYITTDWQILHEMQELYAAAATPEEAAVLRRYRKLRREAPGFDPAIKQRRPEAEAPNNHERIPRSALAALTGSTRPRPPRNCEHCGRGFSAARPHARTCSPRCRKALSRCHTSTPKQSVPALRDSDAVNAPLSRDGNPS